MRALVEELYRSNAGVVGPKLVSWDDPSVLQHVGLGLDRFGEVDPITEPGEYDQEQHDAVRDVFVLPSACLLVRADLFRALGGFDPAITFHGDDVDLCWRVHLSGARVVVAPQARARHREELEVRRPDLHHDLLRARHRMRSVATLTGTRPAAAAVPGDRRADRRRAGRRAVHRALRRGMGVDAGVRRAAAALAVAGQPGGARSLRRVGDAEILDLQNRGSARLTSYRRARDTETYIGTDANVRRWRESSLGVTIAWVVVVVGIIVASRTLIDTSVPSIGELRPLPDSPRQWWSDFVSGWNPAGLGATVANPTGWAVVSIASVLWLFRMGLGLTVLVVGLVFLGVLGAWRLATLYPSNRARIAALLVYAAIPLVPGVISTGRLTALVAYAAVPWFVHLLRVAVGIGTADPARRHRRARRRHHRPDAPRTRPAHGAAGDRHGARRGPRPRCAPRRRGRGRRPRADHPGRRRRLADGGVVHRPRPDRLRSPRGCSTCRGRRRGRGTTSPRRSSPDRPAAAWSTWPRWPSARLGWRCVALALYVPVLVALAVGRAWRLTWAARASGLIVVFLALAVLQDRDALSARVPDVGVLLVPVGLGLAIGAASAVAAFGEDVAGRTFGWRQPAGVLSVGAVAVGLFPALLTIGDGAWFMPDTQPRRSPSRRPLAPPSDVGDYRVLYLGDPRLIPFPTDDLGDGVAMAVVDDGSTDLRDRWPVVDQPIDEQLRAVIEQIADRRHAARRAAAGAVRRALRRRAAPRRHDLDGGGAAAATGRAPRRPRRPSSTSCRRAARRTSPASRTAPRSRRRPCRPARSPRPPRPTTSPGWWRSTRRPRPPMLTGTRRVAGRRASVAGPGVVHFGTPLDGAWRLEIGGTEVDGPHRLRRHDGVRRRRGRTRRAALRSNRPRGRSVSLLQALLWVAVLVAASRIAVPARLRPRRTRDETLIDLDAEPGAGLPDHDRTGFAGWVDELFDEEERTEHEQEESR